AHTPHTITDKGALLKRLGEVREAGFAINKQELVLGMAAIAAPVMKGAMAEGSIGASFPVQLLEQEGFFDEVKERIVGTAKKVAL
ncbi:MAG: IclR family transcriptional regulator C-terminal domain-containing protein, partial [Proteobacteria bacterium]|nr:IclR family transcriptional regulator C-terminal domain-containing protein [Pseudomonadota bacterium]